MSPEMKVLELTFKGSNCLSTDPSRLRPHYCNTVKPDLITVKESTVCYVPVKLFKGRDSFYKPKIAKNQGFENEVDEHIHLLQEKKVKKCRNHSFFLQSIKRVENPNQDIKVSQPLKIALTETLPDT